MIVLLWIFCAYALIGVIVVGSIMIAAKIQGDTEFLDFFKDEYSGIEDLLLGWGSLIFAWPAVWSSWRNMVLAELKLYIWNRFGRK